MRKKLALATAAAALAGGLTVGLGGPAAAAHCTDDGKPGHSDFAAHVRTANGPGGHNEGDHRGWSSCETNSANFVN